MDIRTMVSPNRVQAPHFPPLYNFTFDEVQTQLGNIGKPLNNMNMDDFLKTVVSSEEGHQPMQNQSSSSSSPSSRFLGNFNLNETLSKKTVDHKVWKEIVHHEHVNDEGNQDGILNPQSLMAIDPMVVVSHPADWLQSQMAADVQQQMTVLDSNFRVSESVFQVMDVNYSENQLAMSVPMPAVAATSSESQAAVDRKRRFSDETMEKTIERRQKRMIKNRESAARSRARKQAYTNRLEHEVVQLRKTNSWLKKQKRFHAGLGLKIEKSIPGRPLPAKLFCTRCGAQKLKWMCTYLQI